MNKLCSAGYGNGSPEKFLERLKDAGITTVLDVRRAGSKSWCASYNQGRSIEKMLARGAVEYFEWPSLGNEYDSLATYDAWLKFDSQRDMLENIAMACRLKRSVFCLLCAERYAYKDGEVNCHRVYVADALKKLLGDGWEVVHL